MKLHLKINVRSSKTKSRSYLTNSERNTGAQKYASFKHCTPKKPNSKTPCLIHNPHNTPHSPQVSNSRFNFCQGPHCMQQTRFCSEISLVILSHHPIMHFYWNSPVTRRDLAPSASPQKNWSSPPGQNVPFNVVISAVYLIFLWGGMP